MRYFQYTQALVTGKVVFCGIDTHLKHWNLCFLCDGEVVEKLGISAEFGKLLNVLKRYSLARQISLVYEARFCGFWLCRQLQAHGYEVVS